MQSVVTPDQQLLERTTQEFLSETSPLSTVRTWSEEFAVGYPEQWWQRACSLGWVWLCVPERFGGGSVSGEPITDVLLIARQIGRVVGPGPARGSSLLALALAHGDERHKGLVEQLAEGTAVGAWCLNEATFFPDSRRKPLTALPDGDGYRLTGVSSAVEYAAQASHLLVTANATSGIVQALVPTDATGVTVSARSSVDLIRRYGVVTLDDTVVSRPFVITDGAAGDAHAERLMQVAAVWQCTETVGLLEQMFETTMQYLFDRFAFGRPLASYQALKHRVADMKLWVEACAATAAAAGRAVQDQSADARELVSVAKSFIGDHATSILQEAVQLHGGIALTWEHDLHYYLRRATQNRSMYGDPVRHRQRVEVAAGLPVASA
jgi:alkylation response protein AidB-like acyl-CoA dehydrogenase